MILKSVLLLIAMAGVMEAFIVCYSKYGCFSKKGVSLLRLPVPLPESPEKIKTTFRLFTREKCEQLLDDTDLNKLKSSDFKGTRRTIIQIHGWTENGYAPWMNRMRRALLDREDVNLITTDWSKGAVLNYLKATGNTKLVGAQVAELIRFLIKYGNTTADRFYLVGFSLGAHIASYAGARLRQENQPIGRITGTCLDAAGPFFIGEHTDLRLDPSDAQFVDVIHTDSGAAGLWKAIGHIDFYVNGGATQPPGCEDELGIPGVPLAPQLACDHLRCPDYYTESVQSQCPMHAYLCNNWNDFQRGECGLKCNGDCPEMGYNAEKTKGIAAGKHYLATNKSPPFCAYHYLLTFKTGTQLFAGLPLGVQVTVNIVGSNAETDDVKLKSRFLIQGSVESFVVLSRKDLGELQSISVRFSGGINLWEKWFLVTAVVKPGWQTQEYSASFNTWLRASGGKRDFS